MTFYVFDEHTDYVYECKKMGMKPIGNETFIKEFIFDEVKYKVLSLHECFSGWEINVMAIPELSYSELLNVMLSSKYYDEIVGSIGIILKKHLNKFIEYLKLETSNSKQHRKIKKIEKIIKKEISERNPNVNKMDELLHICKY